MYVLWHEQSGLKQLYDFRFLKDKEDIKDDDLPDGVQESLSYKYDK